MIRQLRTGRVQVGIEPVASEVRTEPLYMGLLLNQVSYPGVPCIWILTWIMGFANILFPHFEEKNEASLLVPGQWGTFTFYVVLYFSIKPWLYSKRMNDKLKWGSKSMSHSSQSPCTAGICAFIPAASLQTTQTGGWQTKSQLDWGVVKSAEMNAVNLVCLLSSHRTRHISSLSHSHLFYSLCIHFPQ